MATTPLRARRYPLESDTPDVAADIHNLALDLENAPTVTQGILSARPASSVAGNRYVVIGDPTPTNNNVEWYDTGSGWIKIYTPPGAWTAFPPSAGFTAGAFPLQGRIENDVLRCKGWLVSSGAVATATTLATLPVGFQPTPSTPGTVGIQAVGGGAWTSVPVVLASGVILFEGAATAGAVTIHFDGLTYTLT